MSSSKRKKSETKLSILKGESITGRFTEMGNLANVLIHVSGNTDRGITFLQNDNSEFFLSYLALLEGATRRLGGLQEQGFAPGQYALILLEDSREFVLTFWACILGGIIPVPASYPASSKVINTSLSKLQAIWEVLERPLIISDHSIAEARDEMETTLGISGLRILEAAKLDTAGRDGTHMLAGAHTPAMIQFSSGSTSVPKGTILTHDNLLTNIESIITSSRMSEDDRSLGWMPYHHDMGLIGFHLSTVACGINQFNMTPMKFVKRPTLWLDMIDKHRITFTGCPNFGLRLVSSRVKEEQLKSWDLSSLRLLYNGAEPISVKTMREFMDKFVHSGLKRSAMYPVYGMAEACLAVSFPRPGEEPLV
ncbi:AMP-binding protein, partial [Paenibacillus graminis]